MLGRNINPLSLYSDVSAVSPVHSRVIKESAGRITSSLHRTKEVARNATTLSQGTHPFEGDHSLHRYSSHTNVADTDNTERENGCVFARYKNGADETKFRRPRPHIAPLSNPLF